MKKCTAMLFAPLPPPVGGITSITAMLRRELGDNPEVLFVQPVPKTTSWKRVVRPLISASRLVRGTVKVRRAGRVVFFCSSRASFWDKCSWAAMVVLLRRTAVMVMVAGDFPESFARSPRIARAVAHWLFRRKSVIVAAQSASWETVYRGIFPHTIVTRVGATVDPEFFEARDPECTAGRTLRVLFVGWIIEDKGIVDLLDAIEHIAPSLAGRVHVRLVGPLFDRDAFWQAEIKRRGIMGIVDFAGAVSTRAEVLREYHLADAFIFPSHFEGFPVALLEATAVGLPCVATNVGGVSDILDSGRAGLIVPPRCPSALAEALLALTSESLLRERLGTAAASHSRESFSLAACVESYERVLGIR